MKHIPPQLKKHLSQPVTTLATCWKITRQDNIVLGFTDHDMSLHIDDITYSSIAGFTPSTIENKSDMSVDNMDIEGQFSSAISEEDLLSGIYNYAEIEIFLVNYQAVDDGKIIVKRGHMGEVTLHKHMFQAEIRGLTQHINQTIGEVYSPTCRAQLGDRRCNIDMSAFTVTTSVTTVTHNQVIKASSLTQPRNWFTHGTVIWLDGHNAGQIMEVRTFDGQIVTLALAMPKPVQTGDTFNITAGCDKTANCCIKRFDNIINFRGEPDIPGMDKILSTATTL